MFNDIYTLYEEIAHTGHLIDKLYDKDIVCKSQQLDPELLETILFNLDRSHSYLEDLITLFKSEDYLCPENAQSALLMAQKRIRLMQSDLRLINQLKQSKNPCDLCYAEEVFVTLYQYDFVEYSVFYAALNYKNGGAKIEC